MVRAFVLTGCLLLALAGPASVAAFSFGAGTCIASADGSFMGSRTHHPGDDGGFRIEPDRAGYYLDESVGLHLLPPAGEVFTGFLIYAEDEGANREGLFDLAPGTTFSGGLPFECSMMGHTLTHDENLLRSALALRWNAPASGGIDLVLRALVLRADPIAQTGTDFYEVVAPLAFVVDGVFRDRFED